MKFVLLASLLMCSVSFGQGYSTNAEAEQDAFKGAAEALYKQAGIEQNVTKYAERQIPDKYKPIIGKVTSVVRIVVTQKLEYKWNF